MIQFCVIGTDKARLSATKYTADKIPSAYRGGLGALIPADAVILDVDSKDSRSRAFITRLIASRPRLFVTKTEKDGGYHIWFKTRDKIKRNTGNLTSLFGWKFDVLTGTNNYIVMPENFLKRKYN